MKLSDKSTSLISIGEDKYISHFRDIAITMNNVIFNGVSIIYRILSYHELRILDRLLPDKQDGQIAAGAITSELEEDIFERCVFHIFGFDSDTEISLDNIEAGIISTVSGIILKRSYEHVNNPISIINNYQGSVNLVDQIRLVISRYYSTSIGEVDKLPLDLLFKKFAVFQVTFPQEAIQFNSEENKESDD